MTNALVSVDRGVHPPMSYRSPISFRKLNRPKPLDVGMLIDVKPIMTTSPSSGMRSCPEERDIRARRRAAPESDQLNSIIRSMAEARRRSLGNLRSINCSAWMAFLSATSFRSCAWRMSSTASRSSSVPFKRLRADSVSSSRADIVVRISASAARCRSTYELMAPTLRPSATAWASPMTGATVPAVTQNASWYAMTGKSAA